MTLPRLADSPAPGRGAQVALDAVRKSYGARVVIDDVSLTISPGEFVSIIGRSGSGKSTLLRLLIGLESPDAGRVEVDASSARLVFQEPRLLPWARVLENVELGLGERAKTAGARDLAQEALARVGLGDRGGAWPAALSGGQRQRVALARALVSAPRFLALDEPLGALDALTRIEMQELLESVWRAEGFTAALVTHDVAEAVQLGDRVILIEGGRIGLDLPIDAPRPRRHGDPALARNEGVLLDRLFGR
jgi:sulfonate transport system ATP-binding protein